MCIGLPLQVRSVRGTTAEVVGRGGATRVDTRLVGEVTVGEWLLVIQGAARERLHPRRAAEIDAALALLDAAMSGNADAAAGDPGFELPSTTDPAWLATLATSTGDPR